MVLMSIIGMRTGYAPTAPPLVTCGLPPSMRQRSVEVPPVSSATTSGKPATSATTARASRGTRQRRRDRLVQHLIRARNAAARLHDEEWLVLQAGAELLVHAIEIAFHVRLDEGVDQGRDRALVLAVFGQHHTGERQRAVGVVLREDVRDAALVGGIGIGMDEADADRTDALPAEELRGGVHAR